MAERTRANYWPPAILATIVISFLVATGLNQWRMRDVDVAVMELAQSTAPGIEHLAAARSEVRSLQALLVERVHRRLDSNDSLQRVDGARRAVDGSIAAYLALAVAPGEQELWHRVFRSKDALDRELDRFDAAARSEQWSAAESILDQDVSRAATELNDAIRDALGFNAARARALARDIRETRRASLVAAIGLDAICTAIAIGGALLLRRAVRSHDALLERHRRVQEERADELEQFAGRVAHDILSPLGTVGVALRLATRTPDGNERTRIVERGVAALDRVKRLVNDLLGFARAGAAPDPDALADVGEVMRDLAAELEPTAAASGTTLTMKHDPTLLAECSPGVLTSLIANLVRNALKYIGDGPVRRVEVRAFERAGFARIEVQDTGPGLPPDVEGRVFDAYVRAPHAKQPGIGLGLATVKRLAEAHHGTVGVRSVPGEGCTFWFELPALGARQDERENGTAPPGHPSASASQSRDRHGRAYG